jgi:hypothetical protein
MSRLPILLCSSLILGFGEPITTDGEHVGFFLGSMPGRKAPISADIQGDKEQGHVMAVNRQLLSLKGMMSHYSSAMGDRLDEDIFANANALNFTIILALIFLVTLTVLTSTAGLVIFISSTSVNGSISSKASDTVLRELAHAEFRSGIQHPGCMRVVNFTPTKERIPTAIASVNPATALE